MKTCTGEAGRFHFQHQPQAHFIRTAHSLYFFFCFVWTRYMLGWHFQCMNWFFFLLVFMPSGRKWIKCEFVKRETAKVVPPPMCNGAGSERPRAILLYILIPVVLLLPSFAPVWFSIYANLWPVNRTRPQHSRANSSASAQRGRILVSHCQYTVRLGICGVNISAMCCFFSCNLMNKRYAFIW